MIETLLDIRVRVVDKGNGLVTCYVVDEANPKRAGRAFSSIIPKLALRKIMLTVLEMGTSGLGLSKVPKFVVEPRESDMLAPLSLGHPSILKSSLSRPQSGTGNPSA